MEEVGRKKLLGGVWRLGLEISGLGITYSQM